MKNYIDPDTFYKAGSQTFFYFPDINKFFMKPFPAIHDDMILDDKEIFNYLYDGIDRKDIRKMPSQGFSRYSALKYGNKNAILGRIGHRKGESGDEIVISLWNNPSDDSLKRMFTFLEQKFPSFKDNKDKIIVTRVLNSDLGQSQTDRLSDIFNSEHNPEGSLDFTQFKSNVDPNKRFQIGGNSYTFRDLESMRKILHTRPNDRVALGVLCHSDISRNPELKGFMPSNCSNRFVRPISGPSNWRAKGRETGRPYVYSYGEFTSWMKFQDLFLS